MRSGAKITDRERLAFVDHVLDRAIVLEPPGDVREDLGARVHLAGRAEPHTLTPRRPLAGEGGPRSW